MTEKQITRRLAAILAADVAGYSRMMGADEAGTIAALRRNLERDVQSRCRGASWPDCQDDGRWALVEFGSVVDAVECAVAIQHAMASATELLRAGRVSHWHQPRRYRH